VISYLKMVLSGSLVQSHSILTEIDIDKLSINNDSLPILSFFAKFKFLTLQSTELQNTQRIDAFVANSKNNDIELYWTQAIKLFSMRHVIPPAGNFETSKAGDRLWIVYNELLSRDSIQLYDMIRSTSIFNERVYLTVLNSVLPILISCFPITQLSLLLKPLVASTLAADHISNLTVNLPSICTAICAELLLYLRDAQEPAIIWRCSRILLTIASKCYQSAISVRFSLVREKVHPLLCLDITRRFIGDTEKFLDEELCSSSTSISINDSWILIGLRDFDLLAISQSAVKKTVELIKEMTNSTYLVSSDKEMDCTAGGGWQREIIRCARIVSICSSVSSPNKILEMADFSNNKDDLITGLAVSLMEAAENVFHKFDNENVTNNVVVSESESTDKAIIGNADHNISKEKQSVDLQECDVEFLIRMSIVLFIVSLAALATAVTRMKLEYAHKSNGDHLGAQLKIIVREELKVAALLTQALVNPYKFTYI
jgi:hypothetical protein